MLSSSEQMRIGILSDTHDHMKNVARIVELFNDAGVDRVVHTGDITKAKTLHTLAALHAPLFGVFGNNDLERDSLEAAIDEHGFHFTEPPLELEWANRRLFVVHDPREFDQTLLGPGEVLLHGHTHLRTVDRLNGGLRFNPGECAGHMPGKNAIGTLDLATLEPEILFF